MPPTTSHPAANRTSVPNESPEFADTEILLKYHKLSEVPAELFEIGQGTPRGDPFSLRHRLVPVPRWLAPKSMERFGVPRRQTCFYLDRSKAKNFRALCWLHTESKLLAKSPLNDTDNRAFMPTRPKIPLRGSMFMSRQRPSNPLRAYGTILPGSSLKSYQQSVPLPRDTNGHICGVKQPKPAPIHLPTPPPGITTKSVFHPCSNGARVMAHRMNLARQEWNTADNRAHRRSLYTQIASENVSSITAEPILSALKDAIPNIHGMCMYAKKMTTIEDSEARQEEAKILVELCNYFHKLLQNVEQGSLSPQGSGRPCEHPVPNVTRRAQSQFSFPSITDSKARVAHPFVPLAPTVRDGYHHPPTSTNVSASTSSSSSQLHIDGGQTYDGADCTGRDNLVPTIWTTQIVPSIVRQQSPVAPDPKLRQKRPRVPVSRLSPPIRVLRSRSKTNDISVPIVAPPNPTVSRVVAPRTTHRQHRKPAKAKQVPSTTTSALNSTSADATPTHSYNLRPRKRKLDETGVSGRGNKQSKRRCA